MSRAAASGMWQFMPGTGRDFKLRQNVFRDDRRDVLASTHAALDYLQRLHTRFGNWHLALAAYNWGQGNVQRAIDANVRSRAGTDYLSLTMPDETRNYVPKLQAIKNIVLRPEAFDLALPPLDNHPFFLTVAVERDIDVALAARLAGLSLDEFQQLNPQLNKPVILAAGTPQLLLPYDNANRFVRQLARHQGPLASWTAWVAPKTLKLAEVSRLTGMPEAELRQINLIPPRMLVKQGSTLLVPRPAHATDDVDSRIADHGSMSLAPDLPPLRRVSIKAGRRGDSVAAVAQRYRVAARDVARWNGVSPRSRLKAGQVIVLLLPQALAARAEAVKEAAKAPAAAQRTPVVQRAAAAAQRVATRRSRAGKPPRMAASTTAATAVAAKNRGRSAPAPRKTTANPRIRVAAR
jgi:membrane-bound lytic murein transglycosylase D